MLLKIDHAIRQQCAAARDQLESMAHESMARCYQCGKCFAGCPMAFAMDLSPTQVMRLAQLGRIAEILASKTIWICSACETCTTRCPQEVDIARVMDSLRNLAYARNAAAPEEDIRLAHSIFLDNVRRFGRVFEPLLVMIYNLRSGHLFKDVLKGPSLLAKGKLALLPPRVRGAEAVRRIFENVAKLRARESAEAETDPAGTSGGSH